MTRRQWVILPVLLALFVVAPAVAHAQPRASGASDPVQPVDGPLFLPASVAPSRLARLCKPTRRIAPAPPLPRSFDGLARADSPVEANGAGDVNGAAGPMHYVQVINKAVGIFDKAGNRLCAPVSTSDIWAGMGAPCAGGSYSDGVVVYDRAANRWVLTRFASESGEGDPDDDEQSDEPPDDEDRWFQCIAVSTTGDPTSAYSRYAMQINVLPGGDDDLFFNDYPKLGVWTDAYYYTADADKIYRPNGKGLFAVAFDRTAMVHGKPAQEAVFFLPRQPGSDGKGEMSQMQPASRDGGASPPPNSPGYIAQALDDGLGFPSPDRVAIWSFQVNWTKHTASFTPQYLEPPAFDSVPCGFEDGDPLQSCVAQPGTDVKLDSLAYGYLGFRLVYRNFGDHEALVLAQTVAASDSSKDHPHTAVRWYEFRKHRSASWSIYQVGVQAPDASDRWLPSIAINGAGDIALGYDVSNSSTIYPSIAYAWRRASTPLGTMGPEVTLQAGAGSQTAGGGTGKGADAFGDYADMTVDPDQRTFWFTSEYYASPSAGSQHDFSTRISAFRVPS